MASETDPRLRWLLLDLNSYFASVEQELCPELRGRPIAVVPVMADTTCAIAASYEAKAFGVRTGTRVGDAKQMCPGIVLVEARHAVYVEYHNRIVGPREGWVRDGGRGCRVCGTRTAEVDQPCPCAAARALHRGRMVRGRSQAAAQGSEA